MKRHEAFVALGGNLGDVLGTFRAALSALARRGLPVHAVSSVYRTRALTLTPQVQAPDYWNAAARLATTLAPRALLASLLEIEGELGRERRERWAPRTLDLDLLMLDARVVSEPGLLLPHPRMLERAFVLVPLAEIAGDIVVPTTGRTVAAHCELLVDREAWILERRAL